MKIVISDYLRKKISSLKLWFKQIKTPSLALSKILWNLLTLEQKIFQFDIITEIS